jgi:hypothetical protein
MILMRYVLRSLNVFNGLLLVAIAAVVYFAVIPVLNPAAQMTLPPGQDPSAPSGKKAELFRNLAPGDYAMISDQNLFHPERKIPLEKPSEKAIPRPDVFLYGTLITSEGSFAFVEDRKAPPSAEGRDKRQRTLRKGATLGGYLLSEVEADRIVLVKGDERVVVMLNDREKRRAGEAPASPVGARTPAGGMITHPPVAASFPQAASSSAQPATSPGQGIGGIPGSGQPSQPFASSSPQAAPLSSPQSATSPGPGIGPGSGLSTRRARVQEIQRIKMEGLPSPSN